MPNDSSWASDPEGAIATMTDDTRAATGVEATGTSKVPPRAGLVLGYLIILVAAVANLNLAVANVALPSIGAAFDSSQTTFEPDRRGLFPGARGLRPVARRAG
jgi:hypothetical protein